MLLSTTDRDFHRLEAKMDLLLEAAGLTLKLEIAEMSELDDLRAEVARVDSVEQSAVTLINGLAAKIAAAGTDPAALKALTDELTTSSDALAAAVAANTVADDTATGTDTTDAGAATA